MKTSQTYLRLQSSVDHSTMLPFLGHKLGFYGITIKAADDTQACPYICKSKV